MAVNGKTQYEKTMDRFKSHQPKPGVSTPSKGFGNHIYLGHTAQYRGFVGTIEYYYDRKIFRGKILDTNRTASYEASDMIRLCEEFKKAVDNYLLIIKEIEKGDCYDDSGKIIERN